jgi:uncharacterized repeat protein (TIGR01451 family)
VFTYTANIAAGLPVGSKISQVSWLAYPQHHILVDRVAEVRVNFPNLETSALTVAPTQGVEPGDVLTYTLVLSNTGLVNDPAVAATTTLPPMLELWGVDPPAEGAVITGARGFTWTTALATNAPATLTYRAVISYKTSGAIENTVYVNDGLNDPLALTARTTFKSWPIYLPLIFK